MSKFEEEKLKKKKRGEFLEELEAIGQESELKSRKWVRERYDREEKKQLFQKELDLNLLSKLRQRKQKDYTRYLSQIFLRFLSEEDTSKYRLDIDLTDKGISVKIRKTRFIGAFKVVGVPLYDYTACKIMAVKVGNTIAKLEGYQRKSDGGVLLPDEIDLKRYGKQVQKSLN